MQKITGRKNKKASGFFDVILVIAMLFVFAIVGFVGFYALGEIKDALESQDDDVVPAKAKEELQNYETTMHAVLDGGIVLWFFVLYTGVIVSSIFLNNSPVFFVIFIMMSIISFFIFPFFTNMLDMLAQTVFGTAISLLPMTFFLINNIAVVILFFIVSTGIALYAKTRLVG